MPTSNAHEICCFGLFLTVVRIYFFYLGLLPRPPTSHDGYMRHDHIYYILITFTTGLRRLIGSPSWHFIFHKRATKYRALLRKMTCKDKGSYESSPPCTMNIRDKMMSNNETWSCFIIRHDHVSSHHHVAILPKSSEPCLVYSPWVNVDYFDHVSYIRSWLVYSW